MSLTKKDIELIKDLMDVQGQHIIAQIDQRLDKKLDKRFNEFEQRHHLEHAQLKTELQKKIEDSENRLTALIQNRFGWLNGALENVTQEIMDTMGQLYEQHEVRIRAIEEKIQIL